MFPEGPARVVMCPAHVRIELNVVAMIYASCAEQKTALQIKLFVVPNAKRAQVVSTKYMYQVLPCGQVRLVGLRASLVWALRLHF